MDPVVSLKRHLSVDYTLYAYFAKQVDQVMPYFMEKLTVNSIKSEMQPAVGRN